ncbi:hypothetical protein, Doubtful CDS [Bradyrhizobium sp. ORS 285]|nr:hypothetical protein, Doubtful CDS [Bradyrhizobium sp. ORS 285]
MHPDAASRRRVSLGVVASRTIPRVARVRRQANSDCILPPRNYQRLSKTSRLKQLIAGPCVAAARAFWLQINSPLKIAGILEVERSVRREIEGVAECDTSTGVLLRPVQRHR